MSSLGASYVHFVGCVPLLSPLLSFQHLCSYFHASIPHVTAGAVPSNPSLREAYGAAAMQGPFLGTRPPCPATIPPWGSEFPGWCCISPQCYPPELCSVPYCTAGPSCLVSTVCTYSRRFFLGLFSCALSSAASLDFVTFYSVKNPQSEKNRDAFSRVSGGEIPNLLPSSCCK